MPKKKNLAGDYQEYQSLRQQEQALVQMLSRCSHIRNKLKVEEMQLEAMHREIAVKGKEKKNLATGSSFQTSQGVSIELGGPQDSKNSLMDCSESYAGSRNH